MNTAKKKSIHEILILIVLLFTITLVGCSGGEVDDEKTYTVIYDGNGGYLGNKTYTIRKLQVAENSVIPKYFSEYVQDPYVVSSLGLATRQGYNLLGWYLPENATYELDPNGGYVYLDIEDGNGVYTQAEEGAYVYGYIQDENGPLIFINVQPIGENDPETTEYIFFDGSNGLGFYIYDAEDASHVEIYEVDGGYLPSELTNYVGYLVYEDLTEAEKTLFAEAPRFKQSFYEYTELDEGLTRYDIESGYVYYFSMFELDVNGEFVLVDSEYVVYDSENPEHQDLERYSIPNRFIFTPSEELSLPSDLEKYDAQIIYWDFEKDRVTSDITLLANWEKKLTVYYVQKSGQVTEITTKQNETNTAAINLVAGELIGRVETIPKYDGFTFVGWSTSETEYVPWDFNTDVFPIDKTELYLYAYMIEGTYTRITTESALAKVADDLDGKYLLVNDIDLGGKTYLNSSPLGFTKDNFNQTTVTPFTGEFISYGKKISNFTLVVSNTQKSLMADSGLVVVAGLFPFVQDAKFSGFTVENSHVILTTDLVTNSVVLELGAAAVIGTALDGNTVINDVHVEIDFQASSTDQTDYPVYIGDIVARGIEYVTISTDSTASIDYSDILNITTDTLYIETLE